VLLLKAFAVILALEVEFFEFLQLVFEQLCVHFLYKRLFSFLLVEHIK
jgi:hypothetical protein